MTLWQCGNSIRRNPWRLLLIAAIFHLTIVLAIFMIGRFAIFPGTFDHDGIGISFAIDSQSYRIEAEELGKSLRKGDISEWNANPRLHVKLYSLGFAALDRLVGPNILSAEPLNLICYLLVLSLVFFIGKEIFGESVGVMAALVVALWPSFLLHTTQMLRDPLFIVAMLLLLLIFTLLLTRYLSWQRGFVAGISGIFTTLFLWVIRGDWWEVVFAILIIGVGMALLLQLWRRKFQPGNALAAVLILVSSLTVPSVVAAYRQTETHLTDLSKASATGVPLSTVKQQTESRLGGGWDVWAQVPRRIGLLRHNFIIRYPLSGSNVDADIELKSLKDVIVYMPRAMVVGLFSPFPNMWFARGAQVGLTGRLVSGAEMLVMYVMEGFALVCVFLQRRRLPVWLLLATILVTVTALGYVVVNISTIYRMRYFVEMLIIVLGVKGFIQIASILIAKNDVDPNVINARAESVKPITV